MAPVQLAPLSVISGVSQGTVLGPLRFLLHINDLPLNVRSKVRLFADDYLLYRPINSAEDQEILQHDLRNLEQWGTKWGMRFNASKCEIMSMHRGRTALTRIYSLGGLILRQVDRAKYLGVTITEDLTWAPHNNIAGKANAKIGFLWRNYRFCPRELREQAYFTLVCSINEYSASVWDPHYKKDITTLDKVQRRAARLVVGDSFWHSSVIAVLQDLGWKSLEDRGREIRLALFFKAVHGLAAVPTTGTLNKADKNEVQERGPTTPTSSAISPLTPLPTVSPFSPAPYLSGIACHPRPLLCRIPYSRQCLTNPSGQTTPIPRLGGAPPSAR